MPLTERRFESLTGAQWCASPVWRRDKEGGGGAAFLWHFFVYLRLMDSRNCSGYASCLVSLINESTLKELLSLFFAILLRCCYQSYLSGEERRRRALMPTITHSTGTMGLDFKRNTAFSRLLSTSVSLNPHIFSLPPSPSACLLVFGQTIP